MIEARFDDLTDAAASFRLVEPVGTVEANRPDEVPQTIAAAEAAARRGLWVAGFVAYEAAPGLDSALAVRPRADGDPFERLPLAWFGMFERREETTLPIPRDDAVDAGAAPWRPSIDREAFDDAIGRIRELIAAGDTYQVNLTLRLHATVRGDERGLYRDLCFAQRGAHGAFLNAGSFRVLSASPELFFRIDGNRLATRPMKGTAPRGRWLGEDEALRRGLVGSVKDRAENAMIVDLLRNDLGRISRTGTVAWSDVFEPERYETVWQLTSTVSSELEPGVGLVDVFRALFPSGSVTGAPKVRTMQIIAELEDRPRGVYCGAVGYLAPAGAHGPSSSFNVAIRTVTIDAETGAAEYGVGGGVTFDSRAAAEYEETVAKSRILTTRRPTFELIETMRRDPGEPIHQLDLHVTRLRSSAAYFGFAFDEGEICAALDRTGRDATRPVRVRLRLSRSGAFELAESSIGRAAPGPVRVSVDDVPVDPADVFLFHKTTLRQRYEEARARHPDADDVLLVNTRGEITESTVANLAALLDGRWWTPPLDAGLLPGTEREAELAQGVLSERSIDRQLLAAADEICLISSTRGRRMAVLLD